MLKLDTPHFMAALPQEKPVKTTAFTSIVPFKSPKLASKDVVAFEGLGRNILADYNINPDDVSVVTKSTVPIDHKTKVMLLEHVLQAHEQAAKNKEIGNLSGRCFATNMMMDNGKWAVATNIELSDEIVMCGERSALINVWNKSLSKLKLDKLRTDLAYKQKAMDGLKVKYLAMSSHEAPGSSSCGNACADCLSWLNLERYFKPDTQIAVIVKNPQSQKMELHVRNLTESLPYWGKMLPSKTDKPIEQLGLDITDRAKAAMAKNNISEESLKKTMDKAKEAYGNNLSAELSGKNEAAAALAGDTIAASGRMDWTRRWFTPPDILAATQVYQQSKQPQKPAPVINAVAYYGDDRAPYLDSLGRISQDRGSGDTLVLVVEDDKLKVRTILDYMPFLYISSKKK